MNSFLKAIPQNRLHLRVRVQVYVNNLPAAHSAVQQRKAGPHLRCDQSQISLGDQEKNEFVFT